MFRISVGMILVGLSLSAASVHGEAESRRAPIADGVPENVAAMTGELLSLSRREFEGERANTFAETQENLPALHAKFLAELTVLDHQVRQEDIDRIKASLAGTVELNVIEMAESYSQHRDRFDEIMAHYNPRWESLGPRANVPPNVTVEHATEKYRSDWELLLLAPSIEDTRHMARLRAFEAVEAIRSDASLPLLEFLYERAQVGLRRQYRDDFALNDQCEVLSALTRYQNAASLNAILQCIALSEELPQPSPKTAWGDTTKEWAVRLLRRNIKRSPDHKWRVVIEAVLQEKEKNTLSEADRTFLEAVLAEGGLE